MKKSILALMVLALLGASTAATAAKDPAAALEKHKQKVLDNIQKKNDCATAAQDATQLKACFPKAKFDGKAATANFAEHKQNLIDRTTKHRDCVTAAQSKEEVKACNLAKDKAASAPAAAAPATAPAAQ